MVWLAAFVSACPAKTPPAAHSEVTEVIARLMDRRIAFTTIEGDVKFGFPSEKMFSPAFEGHAAYEHKPKGGRVRLIAAGPLGAMPIDLTIRDGAYLVKLADQPEPLDAATVERLYGRGALYWVGDILSKRPGLFFGGIPDDLSGRYSIVKVGGATRIESVDDGVAYEIDAARGAITKAVIANNGIGELTIAFGGWDDTADGPMPTEIEVFFGAERVLSFTLKQYEIGRPLPAELFPGG